MTDRRSSSPTTGDLLRRLEDHVAEARAAGAPIADAFCLSTATPDGRPSARMLIFKGIDDGRVTFATNYDSRKGEELDRNPRAALTFAPFSMSSRTMSTEGSSTAKALKRGVCFSKPRVASIETPFASSRRTPSLSPSSAHW